MNHTDPTDNHDVCHPDCGCGPKTEITNDELRQKCAFLWMVICRNCEERPVPVSIERFAQFIATQVQVDYVLINAMLAELFEGQSYATTTYVNQQITTAINGIVFPEIPEPLDPRTDAEINNLIVASLAGYCTCNEVDQKIIDALANYYTRTQVNDLIANLQSQVTQTAINVAANTAAIAALADCCDGGGGGGTGTPLVAPSATFTDILSTDCPATTSADLENPDGIPLTYTSTGDGVVTVTVDGAVVTSPFNAPNFSNITIEVNAAAGQNAVGGVTIGYDNGSGFVGIIDGVQYDVTCPVVVDPNSAPTSAGAVGSATTEVGTATTIDMTGCFSDADGDTLTYAITPSPLPTGFTFNTTTGIINVGATAAVGTYSFSVTANDGTATSPPCTVSVEVTAVATPTVSVNGNCPFSAVVASSAGGSTLQVPIPFDNIPASATWLFTELGGNNLAFSPPAPAATNYTVDVVSNQSSGQYNYNVELIDNGQVIATCGVNTVEVTSGTTQQKK